MCIFMTKLIKFSGVQDHDPVPTAARPHDHVAQQTLNYCHTFTALCLSHIRHTGPLYEEIFDCAADSESGLILIFYIY